MSFGILAALIAALLFGLSSLGQKAALPPALRFRALLRNRRWLLSVGLGGIGALAYLAALALAPLSSVMPLVSASFVVPVVGGALWLREPITRAQWLSVALVLIGVALVTAS